MSANCSENPSQDLSPFHPFPSSLSPGEREEGEGSRGEGLFSWFPGARQQTGMSDCFENTPHPFTPSPLRSPLEGGKRGRGVGERGHFRHFHGFWAPVSRRA